MFRRAPHVAAVVLTLTLAGGCRRKESPTLGEQIASAAAVQASAMNVATAAAVSGQVHSVGGELGTWDIPLTDCQSGQHDGFNGVDLYTTGSNRMRVRYVHDEAAGEIVKVAIPSTDSTALVFRQGECAILEGSLARMNFTSTTGTRRGETFRHLEGHVKFDCKHSEGKGEVKGEATFTHCH